MIAAAFTSPLSFVAVVLMGIVGALFVFYIEGRDE